MTEHEVADVVVVGSGAGALLAAAHVAAAGKKVVVLEHHDIAGGNCTVFRRGDFEFDVGLHYIGDCGPGGVISSLLAAVGLGDRLEFTPMDQDGFDTLKFPDFDFCVPGRPTRVRPTRRPGAPPGRRCDRDVPGVAAGDRRAGPDGVVSRDRHLGARCLAGSNRRGTVRPLWPVGRRGGADLALVGALRVGPRRHRGSGPRADDRPLHAGRILRARRRSDDPGAARRGHRGPRG